jgi:hypothetical protein
MKNSTVADIVFVKLNRSMCPKVCCTMISHSSFLMGACGMRSSSSVTRSGQMGGHKLLMLKAALRKLHLAKILVPILRV